MTHPRSAFGASPSRGRRQRTAGAGSAAAAWLGRGGSKSAACGQGPSTEVGQAHRRTGGAESAAATWLGFGLLVLVLALVLPAAAQPLPPSPAALSEAARPVRVVCIADNAEAFLRDDTFRERVLARLPSALPASGGDTGARLRSLIAPLGSRFVVPIGSGFVVDAERRHVVTNWHVAAACQADRGAARQVGIVEAEGADITATSAERLPSRAFHDAAGKPVKLIQALCRDRAEPCGADLPRGADEKPMADAQRRRQLDNLLAYAPDLAVLRLESPARAAPLPLALSQPLDDQMRLVLRTFGPVPAGIGAADAAARQQLVAPVSVGAVYTGPRQISHLAPGAQPGEEVHVRLHRMTAAVQPGQSGAAVMRGPGVVGVLTALAEPPGRLGPDGRPVAPAYAVPVTVLAVFLDLLKVPYTAAAAEAKPAGAVPAPSLVNAPATPTAPAAGGSGGGPQTLMIAGAVLLAALAAAAFFVVSRRRTASPPAVPPPSSLPAQQHTVSRINPTVLHAVAMPTSAFDTLPPPPEPGPTERTTAGPRSVPPPPASVHLHCSAGPLAPLVFSLPMPNGGTSMFVGRDGKACQVVFPAHLDLVSGVHACFVWDGFEHKLTLRDLSSSGTWVNGERIDKGRTVHLGGGDRVELGAPGANRFTVELVVAPAAPPPTDEPPS